MMTATIFVHPQASFQFLSICHYITSFGLFFYNNDLITIGERDQTIPVLNAFFEYLNKSNNEFEAKRQLLQKVLKGTDLYGGGKNETLDVEYVNKHYQYIISEALFSHYNNIIGYLAEIINSAETVNYSALKEIVYEHLSNSYTSREYCSSRHKTSNLTSLAIRKIFQDYVWSMFPETEEDMNITDINYVYAMCGLKIARTIPLDTSNLNFDNYILLSRRMEFMALDNETYQSVLLAFSTPALFFYAFEEKTLFREWNMASLSDDFWIDAYVMLFSYLNITVQNIIQETIESSLHFKLENDLAKLKSRTSIAASIIQKHCHFKNEQAVPPILVSVYKTLFPWLTKMFLPSYCHRSKLPNLERVYQHQFEVIRRTFNGIEKNSINETLIVGDLLNKVQLPDTIILLGRLPEYSLNPSYSKVKSNIYLLFAIKRYKKRDFYAFKQEKSVLSLLRRNGNEKKFTEALGFDPSLETESSVFTRTLKRTDEGFEIFIRNVANIKTNQFIKDLSDYYKEPTAGEKVIHFIKSLVPFYSCIENIETGKQAAAALTCSLDMVNFIPFATVRTKYTSIIRSTFSLQKGELALITKIVKSAYNNDGLAVRTLISPIFKEASKTVANEVQRNLIINRLAQISTQAQQPGYELSFQINKNGTQFFLDLFENILSITKFIPRLQNFVVAIKNTRNHLQRNMNFVSGYMGMVRQVTGKINGHEALRYIYPGGSHFFGPICLQVYNKIVELRSLIDNPFEIPVVLSHYAKDLISYRRIDLKTGNESNFKLELDKNDILRRVGYLINRFEMEGFEMEGLSYYDAWNSNRAENWEFVPSNVNGHNLSISTNQRGEGEKFDRNLTAVKENIDKIYAGIYGDNITEAFEIYMNSPKIQRSLRFEDYFVLRSQVQKTLVMDKDANRRRLAAAYRLALRQSDEEWVKQPITLYRGRITTPDIYEKQQTFRKNDVVLFKQFKITSEKRELEEERFFSISSSSLHKPLLYQIELKNQIGVGDIGRIIEIEAGMHMIPPRMKFVIENVRYDKINGQEVVIIKMHDFEISAEKRRDNIINEISSISSTKTFT